MPSISQNPGIVNKLCGYIRLSGPAAWKLEQFAPIPPEIRHVVQCNQVSVKDLLLQTESSLMIFLRMFVLLLISIFLSRWYC